MSVTIRVDPYPSNAELNDLMSSSWDQRQFERDYGPVLSRSLAHIGAYDERRLIGFVNVAWDGAAHAFILDTCVRPTHRRQGVATALIAKATEVSRAKGATWLHVDFEPHLNAFYQGCGFRHTDAGLVRLQP